MESIDKDFIDEAVDKAYKAYIYRQTQRRARLNRKTNKRKQERQNRKRGRK